MNGMKRSMKVSLGTLYRAALNGVDPAVAVARALQEPTVDRAIRNSQRVGVLAVGKAAAGMLEGARRTAFEKALVVLPRGYRAPRLRGARVRFASHPEPDRSSVAAADEALKFFSDFRAADLILCLISGGTSSLMAKPRRGLSLDEKRRAIRRLASSGASIVELNRLRSRLSSVKAGRLGQATEARLVTLVLSDVPGDKPSLVGSGPTIRGRRRDITKVVASNRSGQEAAAREASGQGWRPRRFSRRLSGEAFEEGQRFAQAARRLSPGEILIGGGETTVRLSARHGRGGRSLEFALGGALELEGCRDVAMLAAGSDGIDGSSEAAGAFADGTTLARARELGLEPERVHRRHDTANFFEQLGDLLITSPTGTNVGDWAFALRI
jgi:hydroxypyruvate reductase